MIVRKFLLAGILLHTHHSAAQNWVTWRGPLQTGVATNATPPTVWSETKNIRWKTAVAGLGHATPVAWNNHLFVLSAVPFGEKFEGKPDSAPGAHDNHLVTQKHRFQVQALSIDRGEILWTTTVREEIPREGGHFTGSLASNSPVTDGKYLYAFFGSRGLYAIDFDGTIQWSKDFGNMETRHAHGEGASPALHNDTLIVNWDHEGQSFVTALHATTGNEKWRTLRDENTSWSSPLIIEHAGRHQVIIPATKRIRSYDLADGSLIWECAGLSRNVVSTPVSDGEMVYFSNSYDWQIMMGIKLDGSKGDITKTDQVVWRIYRNTSYVPSPLLYDERLYVLGHNQGIMTIIESKTGKTIQRAFRLPDIQTVFASPMGANGNIYVNDMDGTTLVFKHGDQPEMVSVNQLDDRFSASPIALGKDLILRGYKHVYCLRSE